jgi:hypothetical protein
MLFCPMMRLASTFRKQRLHRPRERGKAVDDPRVGKPTRQRQADSLTASSRPVP